MQQLESLALGIYRPDQLCECLKEVNPRPVRVVPIGYPESKKPDLAAIVRFHSLKKLCLVGQQKNLDVLSNLRTLEDLTLGSVTVRTLRMVRAITATEHPLRITLGWHHGPH